MISLKKHRTAPPCPARGPEAGSHHNSGCMFHYLRSGIMTRKNHRKFPGPPFRKEALKQGSLIIIGPFNNFHRLGLTSPASCPVLQSRFLPCSPMVKRWLPFVNHQLFSGKRNRKSGQVFPIKSGLQRTQWMKEYRRVRLSSGHCARCTSGRAR